jgi:hypothetical protein
VFAGRNRRFTQPAGPLLQASQLKGKRICCWTGVGRLLNQRQSVAFHLHGVGLVIALLRDTFILRNNKTRLVPHC